MAIDFVYTTVVMFTICRLYIHTMDLSVKWVSHAHICLHHANSNSCIAHKLLTFLILRSTSFRWPGDKGCEVSAVLIMGIEQAVKMPGSRLALFRIDWWAAHMMQTAPGTLLAGLCAFCFHTELKSKGKRSVNWKTKLFILFYLSNVYE